MPRAGTQVIRHPGVVTVRPVPPAVIGETMPDLRGTPKRALMSLFNREDISLVIRGEGFVVRQSPAPGVAVPPGTTITLELE
jgi:cell division protein FtsI (penicillin-binding protein 3)